MAAPMAHPLLTVSAVDRGVLASAVELFQARHYPSVIALVSDALEGEPGSVPLLLVRARAHIALRQDHQARADLRDILRVQPGCGAAYRLLGELAARRNENESAAMFFREALRLAPDDSEAKDWLLLVAPSARPAAVAKKLPAPAAAAGRFLSPNVAAIPIPAPPRFARGTKEPESVLDDEDDGLLDDVIEDLARGRQACDYLADDETTNERSILDGRTARRPRDMPRIQSGPLPDWPETSFAAGSSDALPAYNVRASCEPYSGITPELPGFADYLVETGILSLERLRAAQAYQRSMRVRLSTAIVTLGLATPQRIEWAAVAHQSQLARSR